MKTISIALSLATGCALPCAAMPFEPDISKFPEDKAVLPARLENMRPGQIRDAAGRGAPCLLPVGTLESTGGDAPLGGDVDGAEAALLALAKEMGAVIAPPIWYAPTGYALSGPAEGTFDMPTAAFVGYLKEVLLTLQALGFQGIEIVPIHDPQGREGPLQAACRFVLADRFNDLWKDPRYGPNWWIRPDQKTLPFNAVRLRELKRDARADPAPPAGPPALPLRLERLRPSELKDALRKGLPLFMPTGVLENHGNQNPVACDTFEALDPLVLAAKEAPAVVAPAIWFGPTGYAVTGPKFGTTDINGVVFGNYMAGVVSGLAPLGFRNVVFVQVHQGDGGAEWNGIAMGIQEYRSRVHALPGYEPGWAARKQAPPTRFQIIAPPGGRYDHAGHNETSWMLALRPEYTDLSMIRPGDYRFCWDKGNESNTATAEWGKENLAKVVAGLVEIIREKTVP